MGNDLQGRRNTFDIVDGDIAPPAFNFAELGPVHIDIIGKDLLAHAEGLPVSADIHCNDST